MTDVRHSIVLSRCILGLVVWWAVPWLLFRAACQGAWDEMRIEWPGMKDTIAEGWGKGFPLGLGRRDA